MPVDDVGHEEGVGLVHAVDGLHGVVGAEVTAAEGEVPEIDVISYRLKKDPRGQGQSFFVWRIPTTKVIVSNLHR